MKSKETNEKTARHDFQNNVQVLKNFARLVCRNKLDLKSKEGLAIVEEVRKAIAFLENILDSFELKKTRSEL
jgi:hypothetical protein